MRTVIARFVREDDGQDLIEYGLLAAVVALGTVAAMELLVDDIGTSFNNIGVELNVN
jgi:pilus assembly protein Flp/PilA